MEPAIEATSQDTPGVLLMMNDIIDASEDEFDRWYRQEHRTDRLGIPGFRAARRYRAVAAGLLIDSIGRYQLICARGLT